MLPSSSSDSARTNARDTQSAVRQTVLAEGGAFSGMLRLDGVSLINAKVEGEITSSGELIIGESAEIDAKISGEKVVICGNVNGDVECSSALELRTGARVRGNISSPRLVIGEGVVFEGYCSMPQGAAAGASTAQSGLRAEVLRDDQQSAEAGRTVPAAAGDIAPSAQSELRLGK